MAIPKTQTATVVRSLGGPVEFVEDYPVPILNQNEVLCKVLYSGVCQSGMLLEPEALCQVCGLYITC